MNRHDNFDSPWTMLGSIIGFLLLARLGLGLFSDLLHSAPLLLVVAVVVLGAVALRAQPMPGAAGLGGRLWSWPRQTPKPLAGDVRWSSALNLWRAGWIGRRHGWPIGVYRAFWGLLPLTVRVPDRAQTLGGLLLSPVGQGKTDSVDVPIVLSEARLPARQRHSLILLDVKGDILAKCADALRASHEVLIWNPSDPDSSTVAFNPLAWVPRNVKHPRFQEAAETAAAIYLAATAMDDTGLAAGYVSDPFWPKMVGSTLKGILLHLAALQPDLTWLDVARYLSAVTPEEMVRHLTGHPRTRAAEMRGRTMREMMYNERVRGAVLADLTERTVLLTDPRLERTLSPAPLPLFDLDRFLTQPTVLVLQVGALGDALLPLLSVVTAAIQAELVRRTRGDRPLPRGVRFILDEAGVIGRIHGLDNGIAMLRSANVGYLVTVQEREQLVINYGEHRARVIVSNLTHRLVLGGTTDTDAAWVCGNLGKRNAYRDLPNHGADGKESWHYTREEWPLLRPDELRHMRFQVVVDSSSVPPTKLRLRRYRRRR